jgi:hypothetical protein
MRLIGGDATAADTPFPSPGVRRTPLRHFGGIAITLALVLGAIWHLTLRPDANDNHGPSIAGVSMATPDAWMSPWNGVKTNRQTIIYEEPSISSRVLVGLDAGVDLAVTKWTAGEPWIRVILPGTNIEGWVQTKDVEPFLSDAPTPTPDPCALVMIAGGSLTPIPRPTIAAGDRVYIFCATKLWSYPGRDMTAIGTLKPNAIATAVDGTLVRVNGTDWIQIKEFATGRVGWVMAEFVDMCGEDATPGPQVAVRNSLGPDGGVVGCYTP